MLVTLSSHVEPKPDNSRQHPTAPLAPLGSAAGEPQGSLSGREGIFTMTVPARLTFVTLAVRDMTRMRHFFTSIGREEDEVVGDWCSLKTVGGGLALFPIEQFGEGMFEPSPLAPDGSFRGFSLACNVDSPTDVDKAHHIVRESSAKVLNSPADTPWGGRSFQFLDPEGNLWSVTYAP